MNAQSDSRSALNDALCRAMASELKDAVDLIDHCLGQLTEDQVWWRPDESMNSIGNLILHVCGNVRQWVVSGVGGAPDDRNRPQEFTQREHIPKEDLLKALRIVAAHFESTIAAIADDQWQRVRTVQAHEVTGIQAAIHSIAHFRGHTQEIVHLTRIQVGENYQFNFIPEPDQHGGSVKGEL